MDNERCNDIYFQLDIATITSDTFLEILSDKFTDLSFAEKYHHLKQTKIWKIDAESNSWDRVLQLSELLHLLERVAENKIQELRFSFKDLIDCYYGPERNSPSPHFSTKRTYSGWTVKIVSVRRCTIGVDFLSNILHSDGDFVEGTSHDSYTGKNLIEEIRIIDCETQDPTRRVIDNTRETILKQEILHSLLTNYRVKIIDIVNTPKDKKSKYLSDEAVLDRAQLADIQNKIDESRELSRQINLLLLRNCKGWHLCRSSIATILLIKKYRTSVFDLLGRDIIRIICELLLDSSGTSIWCHQTAEIPLDACIIFKQRIPESNYW